MSRRGLTGLLAALAGCEAWEVEPPVRLPPGLVEGAGDPRRWALSQATEWLLDRPGALAGQPARAALAAALVEYLATAFQDGRYPDGRHVTRLLREGRGALRAALGLDPGLAPQAAADLLFAAAGGPAGGKSGDGPLPAALATLGPPGTVPRPLQRALRATRDMAAAELLPR